MCKMYRKTRMNFIFLENGIHRKELIFDLVDNTKPKKTEFPFFNYNRQGLRKHWKIKRVIQGSLAQFTNGKNRGSQI